MAFPIFERLTQNGPASHEQKGLLNSYTFGSENFLLTV